MEHELQEIRANISENRKRIEALEKEQHRIDKIVVEIKADLNYIKSNQESLNSNLSRFLWIVGGGFIAAIVSFIIKGGLNGGS